MKLLDKFKQLFTGEKKPQAEAAELPPIPIKPGKMTRRWLSHGFRFPAHKRVYKKRRPLTRFIDGRPVVMSFRRTRMHDIYTEMREAAEIRRSFRERQLERRAA